MMKFDCPHCGELLVHSEAVAGREGWCRFCKCILVMPQPGEKAVQQRLTLQEQFAQLERMFRFAAGIVDEHRQLQATLTNGKQGLANAIRSRAEAERAADALRKELECNHTVKAQLEAECKRLADALERSMSEHTAYQTESEKRLAQVKLELKTHENRDGLLLDRVLAIEEDINRAERIAKESLDEISNERDQLAQSLRGIRTELAAAREAETALKARIDAADQRERAAQAELLASKAEWEEQRQELEQECKRLTSLYAGEVRRRNEAEEAAADARNGSADVSRLEHELAEARAALKAAEERHDALAEQCSELSRALEDAQKQEPETPGHWEAERQELLDQVEHYRTVLQKVEDDLSAIDAKRQKNEASLRAQLDEKQVELQRESTARINAERAQETAAKELAASKAALASAEENLKLLRESTASLKAEIDTVLHAKAV